jgi:saccharopine dehydrogenase-like NADP-dependent oxidoreductase
MTSERILVLGGAGHIGSRIVQELRKLDPSLEIVVGDKNVERAREVVNEVGGRVGVLAVDASSEDPAGGRHEGLRRRR